MQKTIDNIISVLRLDSTFYEEIKKEKDSLSMSLRVILISCLAAGFGAMSKYGILSLLTVSLGTFINWMIWIYAVYIIGTSIIPESREKLVSHIDFIKILGFATAPGVIRALAVIDGLYYHAVFISYAWILVSMVIAVKTMFQIEDYLKAFRICGVGWIIMLAASLIMGATARSIGL